MTVFVSHASADADHAKVLCNLLTSALRLNSSKVICTARAGTLRIGDEFNGQLLGQIANAKVVLALVSPAFLRSHYCWWELGAAMASGVAILPVCVHSNVRDNLPQVLSGIEAVQLSNPEAALELLRQISILLGQTHHSHDMDAMSRACRGVSVSLSSAASSSNWIYVLISRRSDSVHRIVGAFQIQKDGDTQGTACAHGFALWVRQELTDRGDWFAEKFSLQARRYCFVYEMRGEQSNQHLAPDGKSIDHKGVIELVEDAQMTPIYGVRCLRGNVHDLDDWADNRPAMYAEELDEPWDSVCERIRKDGLEVFSSLQDRL